MKSVTFRVDSDVCELSVADGVLFLGTRPVVKFEGWAPDEDCEPVLSVIDAQDGKTPLGDSEYDTTGAEPVLTLRLDYKILRRMFHGERGSRQVIIYLNQKYSSTGNFRPVIEARGIVWIKYSPEVFEGAPETPATLVGPKGEDGSDGKSAYELAVEQGFVGTVDEWLETLKGADGADGEDGADGADGQNGEPGSDGKSAYELAVEQGFVGTLAQWLASLKGSDGAAGADGSDGADGIGISSISLTNDYKLKIVLTDGTTWTSTNSIRGAKGETGEVTAAQLAAAKSELQTSLGQTNANLSQTSSAVQAEILRAKNAEAVIIARIGAIGVMEAVIADELPEPESKYSRYIYLIPSTNPKTSNIKDEFICVRIGDTWKWEQIGSTAITIEFDDEPTEGSQKAVRSGGVWSWVKGLLNNLTLSWDKITGKPTTFPPESHGHTASAISGLAQVATSGSYNDLDNRPTIPAAAKDGKLKVKFGNDEAADKFSANQQGDSTLELSKVAGTGSYNDLTDKPSIPTVPTKLSEFQNDSGFITDKDATTVIKLTNRNETMADILARLTLAKTEERYPFFDPSSFAVNPVVKLVSIDINVTDGSVRVQDVATGRIFIGSYVASETIGDVLSRMVKRYCDILVTATRKDGETVSDVNVYLYEGTDDTGRLVETKAYSGSPVTFRFVEGEPYFIKMDNITGLFNPTTASGIANVVNEVGIIYGDADHIETFEDIKMALVALGTVEAAKEKLVGRVSIADTWTDLDSSGSGDATPSQDAAGHPIWDDPMVCTDVQMVEDADGNQHLSAIMMRQYATAKKIQFDPKNWDVATEEVAQDGITYYGSTTASPSSASNVTVLSLSPGDAIPYGSYNTVFRNTVNDPNKNVIIYGYNRYQYSAWRQYLNAPKTAGKGLWWTKQRVGQVSPNDGDYNTHPYQAGCSAALLAAIKPIKRTVAANTATDGGGTYQVCDLLWLPAHVEMFGKTDTTEGSMQQEYWRYVSGEPAANPKTGSWAPRKQYNVTSKSSAVGVWLRSANASNSDNVYAVNTNGVNANYSAYGARAGVPACAIY